MATIKSFSDLEQSRKLAEILPLDSADMCYLQENGQAKTISPSKLSEILNVSKPQVIPCWSLASLFNVLPHIQEFYPTLEKINDKYVCRYKGSGIWTNGNDPIDACYEMVLKLHEHKLL